MLLRLRKLKYQAEAVLSSCSFYTEPRLSEYVFCAFRLDFRTVYVRTLPAGLANTRNLKQMTAMDGVLASRGDGSRVWKGFLCDSLGAA